MYAAPDGDRSAGIGMWRGEKRLGRYFSVMLKAVTGGRDSKRELWLIFWSVFHNTSLGAITPRQTTQEEQNISIKTLGRLRNRAIVCAREKSRRLEAKQIIGHKSSSVLARCSVALELPLEALYIRLDWGRIEFDNLFFVYSAVLSWLKGKRVFRPLLAFLLDFSFFRFLAEKNVFLIHNSRDEFSS